MLGGVPTSSWGGELAVTEAFGEMLNETPVPQSKRIPTRYLHSSWSVARSWGRTSICCNSYFCVYAYTWHTRVHMLDVHMHTRVYVCLCMRKNKASVLGLWFHKGG